MLRSRKGGGREKERQRDLLDSSEEEQEESPRSILKCTELEDVNSLKVIMETAHTYIEKLVTSSLKHLINPETTI